MGFACAPVCVEQAGPHYPAPYAILDSIEAGVNGGHAAGSKVEREKFGALGMTPVSTALRGIFFAQTETKKNPFGSAKRDVKVRVGVLQRACSSACASVCVCVWAFVHA